MQVILVQEHYRSIMIHKINQNNQNNKKLLMYYYILYNKMLFSKKTLFEYQELFFDIFIYFWNFKNSKNPFGYY